jgi:hypothetical protein
MAPQRRHHPHRIENWKNTSTSKAFISRGRKGLRIVPEGNEVTRALIVKAQTRLQRAQTTHAIKSEPFSTILSVNDRYRDARHSVMRNKNL